MGGGKKCVTISFHSFSLIFDTFFFVDSFAADPVMKQAISSGSRLVSSPAPSLLQIVVLCGAVVYSGPHRIEMIH